MNGTYAKEQVQLDLELTKTHHHESLSLDLHHRFYVQAYPKHKRANLGHWYFLLTPIPKHYSASITIIL